MVKTLLRIADSECGSGTASKSRRVGRERHYQQPSREVVEQLAESSVGDIRSAINALQFTCRTGNIHTNTVHSVIHSVTHLYKVDVFCMFCST